VLDRTDRSCKAAVLLPVASMSPRYCIERRSLSLTRIDWARYLSLVLNVVDRMASNSIECGSIVSVAAIQVSIDYHHVDLAQ